MNKLVGLDKLIAEVLGVNEEAPVKPDKGSVKGIKGTPRANALHIWGM